MDPEYPIFPYQDPGITNGAAPEAATASSSDRHGATTTTNWARISAAVLESLRDLHYVLSLAGTIEHVSPNSAALLGYAPEQLIGTVMADHVHEDDAPLYRDELREASSTGRPFRFYCRVRSCHGGSNSSLVAAARVADTTFPGQDEAAAACHAVADGQGTTAMPSYSVFEVSGRFHEANPPRPVAVGIGLVATPPCDESMFVLMARPYPLAQSRRLDSFLSLKMENERLTQQLAALKAEKQRGGDTEPDQLDTEQQQQHEADYPHRYAMAAPSSSSTFMTSTTSFNRRQSEGFPWFDATPSTITRTSGSASSSAQESVFSSVSTPFGPASSSSSTNTSVSTKPGTPVTSAPATTKATVPSASTTIIPSVSKSPTNTPTVMEGDVGIPFIVKALTGGAGIKKRAKHVEDYVCAWCSTTASPEWRKGPGGPKSLCNACGLRYAKSRRKTAGGNGSDGSGPATGPDAGGASAAARAGAGGPTVGPVIA